MVSFLEECIQRIRERANYFLIEGDTHLFEKSKYPFEMNFIPVMCRLVGDHRSGEQAFQSCNRSITFPFKGGWFKCKAIGIPCGISQPLLVEDKIYTYNLMDDPTVGFDVVIWGFHDDPNNEVKWMRTAKECGLPAPEPVGWAEYNNLFALEVHNKEELFNLLKRLDKGNLIKRMIDNSKRVKGGCIFCIEGSDIRVDEVLSAFSYPFIDRILDFEECYSYVKWLGFSCGYNLKLHHENGLLHGSRRRPSGLWQESLMTNSYVGNHVLGETRTWMTDYDMTSKIDSRFEVKQEIESLIYLMNPLLPLKNSKYKITFNNLFLQRLASSFEKGVKLGYSKDLFDIESKLKKRMLKRATEIHEEIWRALGLQKAYVRSSNSDFYFRFIASGRVNERKLEEAIYKLRN